MITTPNRISGAIAAMEQGEQVDWQKLADLQALDIALVGRQFAEDAITFNEQQTDMVKKSFGVE